MLFRSLFFFFKQKTAYEIVDCDWSSDVCSSDLTETTFSWVIIPRPHENVVSVLPIDFTEDVQSFRQAVEQPILPGSNGGAGQR